MPITFKGNQINFKGGNGYTNTDAFLIGDVYNSVDEWFTRHPEAVSAVPDGSLTKEKFSSALQVEALKDYVTPDMFGAVGDGAADDYAAIMQAVNFSVTNKIPLVFLADKTYYTTNPIVIAGLNADLYMGGSLFYLGNETALTIRDNNLQALHVQVNVVGTSQHKQGSTGAKLINLNNDIIEIVKATGFETGIEFTGDGAGNAYNTVLLGYLVQNLVAIKLNALNNGWVNENKFFGGRIGTYSGASFATEAIGILITGDGTYYSEQNLFFSPSIEGIGIGLKCEYASGNRVLYARAEGVINAIQAENSSESNIFKCTYGTGSDYESKNNYYLSPFSDINQLYNKAIVDVDDFSQNRAGNGSLMSVKKLYSISSEEFTPFIRDPEEYPKDGVVIPTGHCLGMQIDTDSETQFLVHIDAIGDHRILAYMVDANGDAIIDEAPVTYSPGSHNIGVMSLISTSNHKLRNVFCTQSNFNGDRYISLPPSCSKVWLACYAYDSSFKLMRFTILGKSIHAVTNLDNVDGAVLPSTPTSEGGNGQFVRCSDIEKNECGWFYFGSKWAPVVVSG